MARAERKPVICFVGPMLGRHPGWVLYPAEVMSEELRREGYTTLLTSDRIHPIPRLATMLFDILRWRRRVDLFIVSIYSYDAFRIGDLATLLIRLLRGRQIFVLHGGALPKFSDRYPRWVRRVMNRADALISPSGYLAHYYRQWGYDVRVIPNLLRVERYPYRHRASVGPNLIWMRTFSGLYNPALALETLQRVRAELPEACLTMAGQDRGMQAEIRQLAREKGLEEAVDFPGFLNFEAKQRLFASHDIYLNTNRVDNTPVSVLEAGAFGLPVVATAVGGIPHLLEHERSALLVPDGDADAMAAAVLRLVREPELAARLSAGGRALAEETAWPRVYAQWQQVFAELA